jgi:hypothetical protein
MSLISREPNVRFERISNFLKIVQFFSLLHSTRPLTRRQSMLEIVDSVSSLYVPVLFPSAGAQMASHMAESA